MARSISFVKTEGGRGGERETERDKERQRETEERQRESKERRTNLGTIDQRRIRTRWDYSADTIFVFVVFQPKICNIFWREILRKRKRENKRIFKETETEKKQKSKICRA